MTTRPTPATGKPAPGEDAVFDDLSIEYPSSDGEPMSENDFQFTVIIETAMILRHWYADRPDVYVGGDMLMYYVMNDNRISVSPDVFAVLGVSHKCPRYSWIVWREEKAPNFVLEVASPRTWRRDGGTKRGIYAGMGVAEYWRFDPTGECFSPGPPLVGERLGEDGEYHPIPLEADGEGALWGRSEVLGLDLWATTDGRLRFYDPAAGEWLRNHYEEAAAREAAEAVLEATEVVLEATEAALVTSEEARRAAEAERQAEAEARRIAEADRRAAEERRQAAEESLRAEEERRQAAKEARQAAEDARRAEAEGRRAEEDEVRMLRERLRELESGG